MTLLFLLQSAGALAGCLPGTKGEELRTALRAQAASGALGIIAGLPAGPGTIVKPLGLDCSTGASEGQMELNTGLSTHYGVFVPIRTLIALFSPSTDQLKALHVSRALCHMQDKPFVLFTAPTDSMSEDQERLFFAYLREQLRPGQVVVLTSARIATARFADHVMQLDEQGGVTERVNTEQ